MTYMKRVVQRNQRVVGD